jgi:hypothetical protein
MHIVEDVNYWANHVKQLVLMYCRGGL